MLSLTWLCIFSSQKGNLKKKELRKLNHEPGPGFCTWCFCRIRFGSGCAHSSPVGPNSRNEWVHLLSAFSPVMRCCLNESPRKMKFSKRNWICQKDMWGQEVRFLMRLSRTSHSVDSWWLSVLSQAHFRSLAVLLSRQCSTFFMTQNLLRVHFFLVSNARLETRDFISQDLFPYWQNIKTLGKGIWAVSSHANVLLLKVNVKKTFV